MNNIENKKIINKDTLDSFCHNNIKLFKDTKPKGIVISFLALGSQYFNLDTIDLDYYFMNEGIVHINPYYNPWSWCNDESIIFTDLIIDAIYDYFNMELKLISSGPSMGGMMALIYPVYSKYRNNIVGIAANCPVSDIVEEHGDKPYRPEVLRSFYSAFMHYDMTFLDARKSVSALYLKDKLTTCPYLIVHGIEDDAVFKHVQSDKLVEILKERGIDVTYLEVEHMGHCDMPKEIEDIYNRFMIDKLKGE